MAFQTALKFWQDFDVPSLQRRLDEEAAQIAKKQDESDASVKRLVELSKEFRRSSSEEVRKKVSSLLKAFQSEVDSLTKRSSGAETMFLTLYKKIIEIPDPVSLLEQAHSQQQRLTTISDLNVENAKLRETLEEYNKEFAHVKNQEATITKLKAQIRELELSAVQRATSKADEIESKLVETYSVKERELQQVVDEYKRKMEDAQSRTSVLQSALESTQSELFELKNKQDDISSARSAEVEMLATDLERANQRVMTAEKQLESCKKSIERSQNRSPSDAMAAAVDTTELELELKAKEKEVTCLLEDVERLQNSLKQLKETSGRQISLLEAQVRDNGHALSVLEGKLKGQEDYEEIKKELSIMKSVEFSSAQHQESAVMPVGSSKPLEVLLLEKNRALVNENTSLKTELSELRDHFTNVQNQYKESLQTIQDQSNLIGQLEADLTRIRPFLPPRSEAEGQAGSEIMAEVIQNIHSEKSGPGNTTESLLNIVTNQRERFKQRNIDLEAENQQQKQSINVLQREMDSLRSDNVKLYEKIRFLQTYQGNRPSIGHDSTVSQYSSQYEAKLDPFSAFSVKERQRKYMQLSGPEKATLLLGRFILSNKVARMVAFCYTILLHIIIMLVLARLVNTADSQTVDLYAECAKQFTEHMHAFHRGDADGIMKVMADGGGGNT